MIEHTRFLSIVQAILTNVGEMDDVNKLNDLLKNYNELTNPAIKKDRKDFAKQSEFDMETLFAGFDKFVKGIPNG